MAYISFQPRDFFSTLLYSYAASPNAISGVGFTPDAISLKSISGTSGGNNWYIGNTVMGNEKTLRWNANTAEVTTTDSVLSFNADGYTLGADATANCNSVGTNYVGYNWKAGTTSGLSGGTITPSAYSINTTSGFGMYKYTGGSSTDTIAHGLGVAPEVIFIKSLTTTNDWTVYHVGLGNDYLMVLNGTGARVSDATTWNSTTPTTTTWSMGNSGDVNNSARDYIAYAWAPVKGYSSFGIYGGNGVAKGPFVYTGFRPAFVIVKKYYGTTGGSGGGDDWQCFDNSRIGWNDAGNYVLNPNSSNAESATSQGGGDITLCANGMFMGNAGELNENDNWYLYMAFAEFPVVSSNDMPGVAR
jgi:hypothetical protein